MKKLKKKSLLLLNLVALLAPMQLIAQNTSQQVDMADQFRADGKIYVVVIVMLVIVLGMSFYAFRIDRKLSKLEKNIG